MLKFDKHFGLQIIKTNLPFKVFNRDDLRNARECKKKNEHKIAYYDYRSFEVSK